MEAQGKSRFLREPVLAEKVCRNQRGYGCNQTRDMPRNLAAFIIGDGFKMLQAISGFKTPVGWPLVRGLYYPVDDLAQNDGEDLGQPQAACGTTSLQDSPQNSKGLLAVWEAIGLPWFAHNIKAENYPLVN